MKRAQFIKEITAEGCEFVRHGKKHDIYRNPHTGQRQPIPRHSELDEGLIKHIRKYLGLEQ